MREYEHDVFISYVRHGASGEFATEMYQRLSATGNRDGEPSRIFIDRNMDGGRSFKDRLIEAIKGSRRFLALITNDYFRKEGFCYWEFDKAHDCDLVFKRGFIVPLVVEAGAETSLPAAYSSLNLKLLDTQGIGWFETVCDYLEVVDPNRPREAQHRGGMSAVAEQEHPARTPDGFLVHRGIRFAAVPIAGKRVWLSRSPVTVGQYQHVAGVHKMPPPPRWNPHWAFGDHPIVQVNWNEANAFCKALDGRLPKFGEWRAACGFDDPEVGQHAVRSFSLPDAPTRKTGSGSQQDPTALGFYDLIGNVWEWCADPGPALNDRWICGGSDADQRIPLSRALRLPSLGFRCLIETLD